MNSRVTTNSRTVITAFVAVLLLAADSVLAAPIIVGRPSRKVSQVRIPRTGFMRGATGNLQNQYFSGEKAIRQDFTTYTQSGNAESGYLVPSAPQQTKAEREYAEHLFRSINQAPVTSR